MTWNAPIVMIGLDAATWDIIAPLMAAGKTPNLRRLIQEGAHGPLQSMIQYPSPALWTSIVTGKSPEKHGVLDFYNATRLDIQVPTLYDILTEGEGDVGLFRWLATWPPVQNNGFTVPAYTARSPETYPPHLQFLNDLARPTGIGSYVRGGLQLLRHGVGLSTLAGSVSDLVYEVLVRPEHREWWYRRRLREAVINAEVFGYLLQQYRPTFSAILFSILDDFGHHYWKYREPELYDDVTEGEARKYGDVIEKGYIIADKAVGIIVDRLPKDTLIVVASDHGQKAIPPRIRPYRISAQELVRWLGMEKRLWITDLGFHVMLRPRESEDGRETLQTLKACLAQTRFQRDARPVFRITSEDNVSLTVEVNVGTEVPPSTPVMMPDDRAIALGDVVYTRGPTSGDHAEYGIFIMKGPGIRRGHEVAGATLLDVTPTVLALRKCPVGTDMDGQVIVDAIEADLLERNPIHYTDSYKLEQPNHEQRPLTRKEHEQLEAKLRALGYLS